jgi:hypothetical protein
VSERARELLEQAMREAREARVQVEENLAGYFKAWIESLDQDQLRYLNSYLTNQELDQRLLRR